MISADYFKALYALSVEFLTSVGRGDFPLLKRGNEGDLTPAARATVAEIPPAPLLQRGEHHNHRATPLSTTSTTCAYFNRWGRAAFIVLMMGVVAGPARSDGSTSGEQQHRPQVEDLTAQLRDMENDPDLHLRLIGQMQEKGLYFASLAHLDAFDRRWPENPRSVLLRADALRQTAYFDQATALYKGLLEGPLSAGANHGLGLIASKKGEMVAALQALGRASRLDPTNAAILNDLGYIQIVSGRLAEAGFNLHKATELDPKNSRAGANLAMYYLIENKPARAEQIMNWYRLPDDHRKEIIAQAMEFKKRPPTIE